LDTTGPSKVGGVVFAMGRNRKRTAVRSEKQASHAPEAIAQNKKLFLAQLEQGCTPGRAAKNIKIARSTAYNWKAEDEEFFAAWHDAIETGLDLLEAAVFERGLHEGGEDARFILRGRRRDVFGNAEGPSRVQSNLLLTSRCKSSSSDSNV
jgi:hypothetical protein